MRILSLPNLLSLVRLPLAAAFLVADSTPVRIAIVVLAALTDLADGYAARRSRSHDRATGQLIDPLADKLFVLIALLTFALRRELSVWELLLALARDIYNSIAFVVLRALHWPFDFKARFSGKTVTVLQLVLLLALLFWPAAVSPLLWIVGITSVVAIADYTRAALRRRPAVT